MDWTFIWSNNDGLDFYLKQQRWTGLGWTLFCEWAWTFGVLQNDKNPCKSFTYALFQAKFIVFWSFTPILSISTAN